jgi:hypothetical protein
MIYYPPSERKVENRAERARRKEKSRLFFKINKTY